MPEKDRVLEDGGVGVDPKIEADMPAGATAAAGDSVERPLSIGPSAVSPPSPSTGVVIEPLVRRSARRPEEHPAPDA